MRAHMWENPEIYQIRTLNQANQNDWPKETQKKCPHKSDSNYHEGATLSLSPPTCLPTHTVLFFPPNKHFTCFTTFRLCGNSSSAKPKSQGLSPTSGLVAGIWCSHHHDPTSITGRELKPCFKLLQGQGHPRSTLGMRRSNRGKYLLDHNRLERQRTQRIFNYQQGLNQKLAPGVAYQQEFLPDLG